MSRASKQGNLVKLLDALGRLYAVRDIAQFPREIMAVAADLVPCMHLSFDTVHLATGQATNVFDRDLSIAREEFLQRWQVYCHEHPGIKYLERGGQASVFAVTDFMTQRQFRRTGVYQEAFKTCGAYQIGVILPVPGYVVGMAINRDRDFAADERRFIELLHPHFVRAFLNAQLFTSLRGHPEVDFRALRNHGLTRRECEVLQWLVEGKRNSEIAVILGARSRTIGKHIENILAKFHVETRGRGQ